MVWDKPSSDSEIGNCNKIYKGKYPRLAVGFNDRFDRGNISPKNQ